MKALSWLIGHNAEQRARDYLQAQGLSFVAQNYRCRSGEIDLVFLQGDVWVFVEVKFRQNNRFGDASEFFHHAKRKKFVSAVQHFMLARRLNPDMVAHRIDVVAMCGKEIQWYQAV